MEKIIIITGPTASGKSALAVDIALKLNGEIVSADSRQVYKDLDIGTEKIKKDQMMGIPHHLLSIVKPTETFSAYEYEKIAVETIDDILKRKKLPIICGGTGFYIDTIYFKNSLAKVEPNKELREKLSNKTNEEIFKMLEKLDKKVANEIDKDNPLRVVRAIEIIKKLGYLPKRKMEKRYDALFIVLSAPEEILLQRIKQRLNNSWNSLIDETKRCIKNGIDKKRLSQLSMYYRFAIEFIENNITKEEAKENIIRKVRLYSKQQIRWIKRNSDIQQFPYDDTKKINDYIKKSL